MNVNFITQVSVDLQNIMQQISDYIININLQLSVTMKVKTDTNTNSQHEKVVKWILNT